ncbi:MAG: hypothetical protein ACD_22C00082G0006 [uncultured bacterium]|nr:MAG: hypothetical protein ACD_22C00082G0006 [uncultured bacterium]
MKIQYIYFDMGGVAILDFSKTNKWDDLINSLGLSDENKTVFKAFFKERETGICKGEDIENLVPVLRTQFNAKLDPDFSLLNGFVSRFEKNKKLGTIIKSLEGKVKMGLLTNAYPKMLDAIIARGLLPNVKWDNIVDSSVVSLAKPQKEIFDLAAKQAGVSPKNILFVENSQMHVDAASKLGWQTLLYDPANVDESNTRLLKMLKGF